MNLHQWRYVKNRFEGKSVRIWTKDNTGPTADGGMVFFGGVVTFKHGFAIISEGASYELWIARQEITVITLDDDEDELERQINTLERWWKL